MNKYLIKYSLEFIIIVLGISIYYWLNGISIKQEEEKKEIIILESILNEINQTEEYTQSRLDTFKSDSLSYDYLSKNWNNINTDSLARVFSKNRYNASFHNLFLDFREFHPPLATMNMLTKDGSFSIIKNENIKLLINQLVFMSYEQVIKNVEMEINLQLSFKELIMKDQDPELIKIIEITQEEMLLRFNGSDNYFEKTKTELDVISKKPYARNYINLKLRHRYFITLFIKRFKSNILELKNEINNEIMRRNFYLSELIPSVILRPPYELFEMPI